MIFGSLAKPLVLIKRARIPTAVRQIDGTSIAATGEPAVCATHGIAFWAKKPPRFPIVLMVAIAVAARVPVNSNDGRNHRHGNSSEMHGVPIDIATSRI